MWSGEEGEERLRKTERKRERERKKAVHMYCVYRAKACVCVCVCVCLFARVWLCMLEERGDSNNGLCLARSSLSLTVYNEDAFSISLCVSVCECVCVRVYT